MFLRKLVCDNAVQFPIDVTKAPTLIWLIWDWDQVFLGCYQQWLGLEPRKFHLSKPRKILSSVQLQAVKTSTRETQVWISSSVPEKEKKLGDSFGLYKRMKLSLAAQ